MKSCFLRLVHSPGNKRESRSPCHSRPPLLYVGRTFARPASRDRQPARATGPGSGQPGPVSRLSRPAAGGSGRCLTRVPPCARPTASERPGSPQAAALAGDPPAGPGVSTGVFPTRDPRPSAAAVILRLTGRPAGALARPRCRTGPSPEPRVFRLRPWPSTPSRAYQPRRLRGRAAHCPTNIFG